MAKLKRKPLKNRYIISIDKVPPDLFLAIKDKSERTGQSMRGLVLAWFRDWVSQY